MTEASKPAVQHTADNMVGSVFEFNRVGSGATPGERNYGKMTFYTGMQCEELAEKLFAIAGGSVSMGERSDIDFVASTLKQFGKDLKSGMFRGALMRADQAELLDGDIDLAIVSLGAAQFTTPHYADAITAVLQANMAKFPDGIATRDKDGKIMKPPGWKAADLTPFLPPADED